MEEESFEGVGEDSSTGLVVVKNEDSSGNSDAYTSPVNISGADGITSPTTTRISSLSLKRQQFKKPSRSPGRKSSTSSVRSQSQLQSLGGGGGGGGPSSDIIIRGRGRIDDNDEEDVAVEVSRGGQNHYSPVKLDRSKSLNIGYRQGGGASSRALSVPRGMESDDAGSESGMAALQLSRRIEVLDRQLKKAMQSNAALEEELDRWKKKYLDSTSSVNQLKKMDDVSSMTIQELQEEVLTLRKQTARRDKEIQEMQKRVKETEKNYVAVHESSQKLAEKETTVGSQVASLKQQLAASNDREAKLVNELESSQVSRKILLDKEKALTIMVRTMKDQLAEEQRIRQSLEERIEVEDRVRKASEQDDRGTAELRSVIEELRSEVDTLREQNSALLLERDRQESNEPRKSPILPTSTLSTNPANPTDNTQIHPSMLTPRTSSAVQLIESLPSDSPNLNVQMMRTRILSIREAENKKLKSENQAIVAQLAASMERVRQLERLIREWSNRF